MLKKVNTLKEELAKRAIKLQTPYTLKERYTWKQRGQQIWKAIRKRDKLSTFMIASTICIVVGVGYIAYQVTDKAQATNGRNYVDKNLNFTLNVPYSWEISTPDEKSVEQEVTKTTQGVLFNVKLHALEKELVPLALIEPDPQSDLFKKVMTMSFRGTDINYSYLNDKPRLMKDFETLMKKLGNKQVKVYSVEDISTDYMKGFLVRGSGVLKNKKVNYAQYFEPAGANILTLTYGTTTSQGDALPDMERIMRSLIYFEGGEFTPSPKRFDGSVEAPTNPADEHDHKEDKK